jgi:hypothetical protein
MDDPIRTNFKNIQYDFSKKIQNMLRFKKITVLYSGRQ